ncbi:MAG: tetratricopeptide repeat protein [Spirochaetales bacterium]|uniref:Tetratricopeptide repeat protein n=1 Tax=Candidatus Thalassospirochaeta sargassi TaxID=3119039 RepID=A0AAJ1MJZ8_9SPIO|nr:tetratricopeptide repeat protein [Spirochaetales bacterium]
MKRLLIFLLTVSSIFVFTACQSEDIVIDENLQPGEYFQEAQTASAEYEDYETALLYYNTFIERYPNETLLVIEAEYEIALLYYKMEDNETALRLFNGIINKYNQPEAAMLPAWPEVLSKKLIGIIEGKAEENPAGEEKPAGSPKPPTEGE